MTPIRRWLSSDVGLVARREIRERVRGRLFRVATVIMLLVVAAAIVIPDASHTTARPERIGVVGSLPASARAAVMAAATSIGTQVVLVPEADVDSARVLLRAGRLDLAIVDTATLLVDKTLDPNDASTTAQLANAIASALGVLQAFNRAGLTSAQVATVAGATPLPITGIQHSAPKATVNPTAIIGLVLLFLMLTQYSTWTLVGVMEEKSSRVVEVLLAMLRPGQLLAGKVLGIGLLVFAQASLLVGFALGLDAAVGSNAPSGIGPLVILGTLVWLVLGYAFYCWVYAAAGSMAERQDQVQSLALPLSIPLLFGYIVSITTASNASPSTFFRVLAYLPPTAPFAMTTLLGLHQVTWWQFTLAALLSVLGTIVVARIASAVYRRAVLRTGGRVRLREVISG